MNTKEFLDRVSATRAQVNNWRANGIKIGKKPKGKVFIEYDETDVKVVSVLAGLSPLLGSGYRVPDSRSILKKVATQVRAEPAIASRDLVFVSTTGRITEDPIEGWAVYAKFTDA